MTAEKSNILVSKTATVVVEESDTEIIIRVAKDGNEGLSTTGKTYIVGSTHGAVTTPSGIQVSMNAYKKNTAFVKGQ